MGHWIYNAVDYKGNRDEIPHEQGQFLTRSACTFFYPHHSPYFCYFLDLGNRKQPIEKCRISFFFVLTVILLVGAAEYA